jgi:hypothetical protein
MEGRDVTRMNFQKVIRQLKQTEALMAEIQRRQLDLQGVPTENIAYMQESMRIHEQRMAHVDMRLASISYKLRLLGDYFNRPS